MLVADNAILLMDIKKTYVLREEDVQELIRVEGVHAIMDELIKRLEDALLKFQPEAIQIPIRDGFNYTEPQTGLIEWMPVYNTKNDVVIKVVGYHPRNPVKYSFPTILSTLSKYDTTTGHLSCLMDGTLATAIRTGAASAVATKLMASSNSSTIGLIGCGAQAVTQLHALTRIIDIEKVLIYDVSEDCMNSFESRCNAFGLNLTLTPTSTEEIIAESDVVCTATSVEIGEGPVFKESSHKSHLHINAVGSDFPGKTEVPLGLLKKSFVCPDFLGQALKEGECQLLEEHEIGPDFVKLVQDQTSFSHIKNEVTVFDSTGWAFEDYVVMELFIELAQKRGLGIYCPIESFPNNEKNPYQFLIESVKAPV